MDGADPAHADLRAAVAAGIVTEAQAAQVRALSQARAGARADAEPFELFRGFGELFVAVGVGILGAGVWGLAFAIGFGAVAPQLLAAAGAWGLAEYLTRRRRMMAPSLLLAVGVVGPAAGAAGSLAFTWVIETTEIGGFGDPQTMLDAARLTILVGALGGLAAALAFYARFRLPFALFLAAVAAFVALMGATRGLEPALLGAMAGGGGAVAAQAAAATPAWLTLGYGVAVFAVAMGFDLRDPHRVTRLSACAFWLHLVAAVALVNTAAASLYAGGGGAGVLAVGATILCAAVVALVIDRRSFLTAGVAWIWTLLGAALDGDVDAVSRGVALAALGAALVGVGAGWTGLRTRLMTALPDFPYKNRLPPWAPRTQEAA